MQRSVNSILAIWAAFCLSCISANDGIVNGSSVSWHKWPFIVSLANSEGRFCGGSILNYNTVITAAHCTRGEVIGDFFVRAGSEHANHGGFTVNVTEFIDHPDYTRDTLNFDFAILKTDGNLVRHDFGTKYVTVAPNSSYYQGGQPCQVAGWGATSIDGPGTPTLYQTVLEIMDRQDCADVWAPHPITRQMFCASSKHYTLGTATCKGDSGGPVMDATHNYLIGDVSFGPKGSCTADPKPVVFGDLLSIKHWIDQHLGV